MTQLHTKSAPSEESRPLAAPSKLAAKSPAGSWATRRPPRMQRTSVGNQLMTCLCTYMYLSIQSIYLCFLHHAHEDRTKTPGNRDGAPLAQTSKSAPVFLGGTKNTPCFAHKQARAKNNTGLSQRGDGLSMFVIGTRASQS